MQIPVFPITPADGVPFPENDGKLDIPASRFRFFKTVTTDCPMTTARIQAVVLAFIPEEADVGRVYEDADVLLQKTCPIGLYCSVEETAESDDFAYVSLNAIARCYLNKMAISDADGPMTIETELEPIYEDLRAEPNIIVDTLEAIINDSLSFENLFDKVTIVRLRAAGYLDTKFHILADAVINDPFQRLQFLQRQDLQDRIQILSRCIKTYKAEKLQRQVKNQIVRSDSSKTRLPHSFSAEELRRRIHKLDLPEESMFSVQRELNRLEQLSKSSSDFATTADYLNWVVSLPWGKSSHKDADLHSLVTALDETHHGLQEVKQDVLEHLALQQHVKANRGSVLCFLGPAGVGKTSIAKEIARVTGRPLVKIALGGIPDESEIRGHRRTYVGSRPGRLIVGARDAGVMDPLFLLDEVDKLQQRNGDPSAALLEALDPEQNDSFVDKYLEIPFDFSQAMFICTANDINGIPAPLLDRMDVINFRKYTHEERSVIVREYMIPRAISEYEMDDFNLSWHEAWLADLIKNEEQLRQLDLRIRKVLRRHLLDTKLGNTTNVDLSEPQFNRSTSRSRVGF